ncbi:MAG: hypothetical protein QM770_09875 [Tepidisphaeraceae bacterium]
MRRPHRCLLLATVLLACAPATWAAPTSRPVRENAASKQTDPASKAVQALLTEAKETLKKKDAEFPRKKPDYFTTAGVEKPTQAQVVNWLNRSTSPNARIDAYVKWQLLSAIEGPFDKSVANDAVRALVNAPALTPAPGASLDVQRELQKALRGIRPARNGELDADGRAAIDNINNQFDAETKRIEGLNEVMLEYRDELIKRFPPDDDALRPIALRRDSRSSGTAARRASR